jgi:tetratricopeptide (TPR) repeat protein
MVEDNPAHTTMALFCSKCPVELSSARSLRRLYGMVCAMGKMALSSAITACLLASSPAVAPAQAQSAPASTKPASIDPGDPFAESESDLARDIDEAARMVDYQRLEQCVASAQSRGYHDLAHRGQDLLNSDALIDAGIRQYEQHLARRRDDVNGHVRLGDLLLKRALRDAPDAYRARGEWLTALIFSPKHQPALERLLKMHLDAPMSMPPSSLYYADIQRVAEAILEREPTRQDARRELHYSRLRLYILGGSISPAQLDESARELMAAYHTLPAETRLLEAVADASIAQARQFRQTGQNDLADAKVAEVQRAIDDSVKVHLTDPAVRLLACQVFTRIAGLYPADPFTEARFHEIAKQHIEVAMDLVNAGDGVFVEVMVAAAQSADFHKDQHQAERIYKQAIQAKPQDMSLRLAYAQFLNAVPERRAEVIRLLEAPLKQQAPVTWRQAFDQRTVEYRRELMLLGTRIDLLGAASEVEKAHLMPVIAADLDNMRARIGESEYLRLAGRLAQAQNDFVNAIKLYNRQLDLDAQQKRPANDDTRYQLARIYVAAQQTGPAAQILRDLVAKYPTFIPVRILLARVLIANGSIEEANPHLQSLERIAPNNPQVIAVLLAAEKFRAQAGSLPAATQPATAPRWPSQ